jgi:hypothetical protein
MRTKIMVGKAEGKRKLGVLGCRMENNIQINTSII